MLLLTYIYEFNKLLDVGKFYSFLSKMAMYNSGYLFINFFDLDKGCEVGVRIKPWTFKMIINLWLLLEF